MLGVHLLRCSVFSKSVLLRADCRLSNELRVFKLPSTIDDYAYTFTADYSACITALLQGPALGAFVSNPDAELKVHACPNVGQNSTASSQSAGFTHHAAQRHMHERPSCIKRCEGKCNKDTQRCAKAGGCSQIFSASHSMLACERVVLSSPWVLQDSEQAAGPPTQPKSMTQALTWFQRGVVPKCKEIQLSNADLLRLLGSQSK